MIQTTFSSVFNITFLTVLQTCIIGSLKCTIQLQNCHVFLGFSSSNIILSGNDFSFNYVTDFVAYNHFILLMISWVIKLVHCFHMALAEPGESTFVMASLPAFLDFPTWVCHPLGLLCSCLSVVLFHIWWLVSKTNTLRASVLDLGS